MADSKQTGSFYADTTKSRSTLTQHSHNSILITISCLFFTMFRAANNARYTVIRNGKQQKVIFEFFVIACRSVHLIGVISKISRYIRKKLLLEI
jgi:hypothetical protein